MKINRGAVLSFGLLLAATASTPSVTVFGVGDSRKPNDHKGSRASETIEW